MTQAQVLYQIRSNYAPGVKVDPTHGSQLNIEIYKDISNNFSYTKTTRPIYL